MMGGITGDQIPKKITDPDFCYISLMRIAAPLAVIHKFGRTRNLKSRMQALSGEWGLEVSLIAYGITRQGDSVEIKIQKDFEGFLFGDRGMPYIPHLGAEHLWLDTRGCYKIIKAIEGYCGYVWTCDRRDIDAMQRCTYSVHSECPIINNRRKK